jgi:hypothetical protein
MKQRTSRGIGSGFATVKAARENGEITGGWAAPVIRFLTRHALTLGIGLVSMIVCFWMISEGTGELLIHRGFDDFYDAQADSLLQGHWDVSPDAIRGEAFRFQGRYYGYFGPTPALPRMLLNRLFPSVYGHWTGLLILLWVACTMAAFVLLMDEFEIPASPFLLAVEVLGSTLVFLCAHAIVYNEAIVAGAALALWACFFFFRYLKQPRPGLLAVACLLSFLSFFARLTVGAGPQLIASFLCLALLLRATHRCRALLDWFEFPSPAAAGGHASLLALSLALTIAAYLSINHAKFGTWLNPAPYQYHVQYDAARIARIQGSINHLSNIPFDLSVYFGPNRIEFTRTFPWVGLVGTPPGPGSAAKIDSIANYTSIPDGMPALAILSILGVVLAARRFRKALPLLAATLAAGCLILINSYVAYRYLHDFYPFLVIAAMLGLAAVRSISGKSLRSAVTALIVIAGLWSIGANLAFALKWQRLHFWPEPGPKASYLRFAGRIDSLLLPLDPEPIRYRIGDSVPSLRTGQLLTVADPPATYRYDGRRWNLVSGAPLHRFRLRVKFSSGQPAQHMPLWFAGRLGVSDAVYIVYTGPTRIEFCSDHWGTGGACGSAQEIEPGREYHVQIDADRLNSALSVTLDGRHVLDTPVELHVWNDGDVLLGKSLAPAVYGPNFTGKIEWDRE